MRDQRDPQALGTKLIEYAASVRGAYGNDIPLHEVWDVQVQHLQHPDFTGDGFISSRPSEHHSKVDQTQAVEEL